MKVLVVEDEKEIRSFLKKSLESEDFVVDLAEDGEKGSFLARTNDYDIILLDNMMPKKNGIEVLKEIREDKKDLPVIMVSVMSEVNNKVKLLNAGADDYLTKPFSLEELLARMRALLRRPKNIDEEVYKIDNLEIDIPRHKVTRDGTDVYLTRKEFLLLKYLLKNRGIVLSRGMILENVWDMNVDVFSNTIESHIRSLRKKITLGGCKKLIHTIPGRGYKIKE